MAVRRWFLPLAVGVLLPAAAHARVFNFKDSNLAAYLRTTGGLSSIGQKPFKDSLGSGDTLEGTTKYQYSGEIGFMYGIGNVNVRLGAEIMQHRPVSGAKGENASGTQLYEMDSSVSAFNPNLTLEIAFDPVGNTRFYAFGGAGMADVTVENKFTMTAAGTSAYGVGNFNEIMTGSATSIHLGFGAETLFTDNVTISGDIGYRLLNVSTLKYKGDANTIRSASGVHKGDPVLNADGTKRSLNLGGLTVGINFRFYLNFL